MSLPSLQQVENPYLDQFLKLFNEPFPDLLRCYTRELGSVFETREKMCVEFAFAVPDQAALSLIQEHAPFGLVEVGAGTGYWASLLSQMGVDIIAIDNRSTHFGVGHGRWFPVVDRDLESIGSERTLFLCWPNYLDPMATDCLKTYRGKTLVYIGEREGGCTANDEFFSILNQEWGQVEEHSIPQWPGIHDYLTIHTRK